MERIKTKITPNTAALFVVIYTAFYLVGSLVMIGIVFGFDLDIRNFWVSQSGTFVIQIALLLAFVFISFKLFYKPWDILKSDYGTVIGKDSKSKLKIALIYVVSTVVVVAMLFALNPVISMFSDAMTAIGFGEAKPDDVSIFAWSIGVDTMLWYHFIIMVFVMGVLPAVAEEVVFRGLLIEKLKGFGFWAIVLMSSFLFMTLHGNIFQSIYQFLLGVICAIAYVIT
ncbi:MAG: CPBP family intramembrane metalloprotease, partial [Firmicutes bacterium]|nr:CPBP family intramembrane metalloprotease [Bacillota bacterium]